MTFNIRMGVAPDGLDAWPFRQAMLVDAIRAAAPDVLGLQEVLGFQADYLRERLPDYHFVGVGRDDGRQRGESSPVMARADRFDLLASGTFWLSATPDVPGSVGWDASLPRVCTYAKLRDRDDGAVFVVANTHFDHRGGRARLESARLLRQRLTRICDGLPLVLMGDFNARVGSPPYDALFGKAAPAYADAYARAATRPAADANADGTFHGFTGNAAGHGRIDWIATTGEWTTDSAAIDRYNKDGRYPSDHFPVTAVLRLTPTTRPGGR